MNKLIAVPAIALAAGLGLAACGSQSTSHAAAPAVTHSAAAAPTTAAPKLAPKPTVNYGQQYLTDIAPYNAAISKLTDSDTITSPDVLAVGTVSLSISREMLTQTWPVSAQADVHALAVGMLKGNTDIQGQDMSSLQTDEEAATAQAQTVRAELGLPAAPTH
jgi:hypothetical protein